MVKKKTKKSPWIIAANWKMNPETVDGAKAILRTAVRATREAKSVTTIICPPFPFMSLVKPAKNLHLGAQDSFYEDHGAYTGTVSPAMLQSIGAEYVIIGHSERRKAGETNEIVAKKVRMALRAGLSVILCIGESQRDTEGNYLAVIREQLRESLVFTERVMLSKLIIAYEPVWAIGGREAIESHDVHQAVIFIRKVLTELYPQEIVRNITILYGGSSNAANCEDILRNGEVGGLLVGGASLLPEFKDMLRIAQTLKK